jgi:hypothetical protein
VLSGLGYIFGLRELRWEKTYIMMLTSGDRKTTFDPRNVRNVAAVLTMSHGHVATERTAQKIWPLMMLLTIRINHETQGRYLLEISREKTT